MDCRARIAASPGVETVATKVESGVNAIQLNELSNGNVVLTTADSDRFIRTQREIVAAMRGADDILDRGRKVTEEFDAMVRDIRAWCGTRAQVASCTLCPRMDDVLAVIVAKDEDHDGSLDDAISALDLEMFSRNRFRVTWLMLRASEGKGLPSFVKTEDARLIYRAV
jgi:hypothetical protein